PPIAQSGRYSFPRFCGDLLSTALESGEKLLQQGVDGVHHVLVEVPAGVGTLDFDLPVARREDLFRAGHSATHTYFSQLGTAPLVQAATLVEALEAQYTPQQQVTPLLRAFAGE